MENRDVEEISHLKQAIEDLTTLNEIASAINVSMSLDDITRIIVERSAKHLKASQGAIFLLGEENGHTDDLKTFVRIQDSIRLDVPLHLDQFLRGWMIKNKDILICNGPDSDPRFAQASLEKQGIHSILAVPLFMRTRLIGLLAVFNKSDSGEFSQSDARFLGIAGSQTAKVIENARLLEREAKYLAQVQNQRVAAIARLAAGVAHELNNPIGAIGSSANALLKVVDRLNQVDKTGGTDPEASRAETGRMLDLIHESAGVISSGCSRVADVVKKLKNFAFLDQADVQEIDINGSLDTCLAMLRSRTDRKIEINKSYGTMPRIKCYPKQLVQAFFEIILNAVESIREKGTIEISTAAYDKSASITIRDSGVGIPQGNIDKIFDPGFTTKGVGVGMGLGLSISHQIIEAHHGKITVESQEDKGTTVTINLSQDLSL